MGFLLELEVTVFDSRAALVTGRTMKCKKTTTTRVVY